MARLRPALTAALALAASGCGKSKQAEQLNQLRATCLGFPESRATFADIAQQFQVFEAGCSTAFQPSGVRGCPFDGVTSVCKVFWGTTFTDRALCSPFGCTAICEIWAVGTAPITGNEVACGTRFSTGQPP